MIPVKSDTNMSTDYAIREALTFPYMKEEVQKPKVIEAKKAAEGTVQRGV
jgi:hypothetical protein